MTDQTDFMVLYRELGIEPDCSMDGLRLAYRRRVADLHPDRGDDAGEDELKMLNQLYAAVIDFHRHYGRLPGSATPAPRRQAFAAAPMPEAPVETVEMEEALPQELPRERRRPSKFVVYGIVVVAALMAWWLTRTDAPLPDFLGGVAGNQREFSPSAAMGLREGMSGRDVVAMLGDPVSRELGGTHWEYGPSWVRFECGRVVDWYSSPLNPLKASRSRPKASTAVASVRVAARCPPGA